MNYYGSMVILLPAILFTMYAQAKVKSAYARYSRVASSSGLTGSQVAERMLKANDILVPVQKIGGYLTDHYNPAEMVMNLSEGVYNSDSIAAISIAAHETGHAIQHDTGYRLLGFRNAIVPVVNLGSTLSWPILIMGLMIGGITGNSLFNLGIILFMGVVVFHLVTLPVELDASKRALAGLQDMGIVTFEEEIKGARRVLDAAALTYLAALAMSILNLVRIFALRRNNR